MDQSNFIEGSFIMPLERNSIFSSIKLSEFNDGNFSDMGSTQLNLNKPNDDQDYKLNFWLESQDSLLNGVEGLSEPYAIQKEQENPQPPEQNSNISSIAQGRRLRKKINNQTKNIPKNFGKAIANFITKHQEKLRLMIKADLIQFKDFLSELEKIKKETNNIDQLRDMWTTFKYAKWMRQLSNLFFRKYGLHYIYNSRISSTSIHVKYRNKLLSSLTNPGSLKYLKEY